MAVVRERAEEKREEKPKALRGKKIVLEDCIAVKELLKRETIKNLVHGVLGQFQEAEMIYYLVIRNAYLRDRRVPAAEMARAVRPCCNFDASINRI